MAPRTWTCQHVQNKVKCGHVNPKRKQICEACGKRRPPSKKSAHKHVLEVFPYKTWVILFGEECGICGRKPTPDAPLLRDHEHRVVPGDQGGGMRGLLCFMCNKNLPYWVTIDLLEKELAYMRRAKNLPEG